MLHQISIWLTFPLKIPYQKNTKKSTALGINHEKVSDVVILFAPREEERRSDDQCERFGHGDGEPDAVDAEKFWQLLSPVKNAEPKILKPQTRNESA